jgi:hypothetical protein
MNVFVLSLLAAVSAAGAPPPSDQKPAGNPARLNACTVLTRDMLDKLAPPAAKAALKTPSGDTAVGVNGSQCDYGGLMFQIDPFAGADRMRKTPAKDWAPVSGVGETAYFHNVRDLMVELLVWSGSHHFGLMMDVPEGSTAEQVKPNLIQLANLIIPKLK